MEFVLISLGCLILLLAVVWRPFFKQYSNAPRNVVDTQSRKQTNIDLYHEHKKEIEQDFTDGAIDEENYQYLLAELDNTLLQDIDNDETDELKAKTSTNKRTFSIFWPVGLSLFILAFSFILYTKQGTFEKLTQVAPADSQHQGMSAQQSIEQKQQQAMAIIKELTSHVEANPDDSEAWYNLGQTLISVAQFDEAIAAIDQVIRLEGEHADLIGAKAQASYYRNNQQIDAQVQGLIDKALALDPADPSTNILLGMHNFIETNYQQAIIHWQLIIDSKKQGVNVAALQDAIAEAKHRMTLPEQPAGVSGPKLTLDVTLATDIAEQLAQREDKVVFVYAIPTSGKRAPLAVVKIMASDLPTKIVLSNQQAMTPENNLSSVERVHLYAIVSTQGGVGIKPGDFKGELLNIDVNSDEVISLRIDHLVE